VNSDLPLNNGGGRDFILEGFRPDIVIPFIADSSSESFPSYFVAFPRAVASDVLVAIG